MTVQEVPVPDPPVLHRVVRAISFSRLDYDVMEMQCEATEYMGLAQTALSIARFQHCLPKSVLHTGQARSDPIDYTRTSIGTFPPPLIFNPKLALVPNRCV
jgi:hypothetical protein